MWPDKFESPALVDAHFVARRLQVSPARHAMQTRSPGRSPGRARLPRPEPTETRLPADGARPLPTVAFANDLALRKRLQEDEARIDAARVALAAERAARRRAHEATVADLLDQGRRLERERIRLEQLQKEALRDQQVERADSDAASAIVQSLGARQRTMQGQLEALRTDIDDWTTRVAAKRSRACAQVQPVLWRRQCRASRTLQRCGQSDRAGARPARGLDGRAIETEESYVSLADPRADPSGDLVTLTFTDVDDAAPARAFSLDLDVAQEAYAGA